VVAIGALDQEISPAWAMRPGGLGPDGIPLAVLAVSLGFRLLAFSRCVRQGTRGSLDAGAQAEKHQLLGCGTSRVCRRVG
jgi:hypothetical protein